MLLLRTYLRVLFLWVVCIGCGHSASLVPHARFWADSSHTYAVDLEYAWPSTEYPDFALPCRNPVRCWVGPSITLLYLGNRHPTQPEASPLTVPYVHGEKLSDVRTRWVERFGTSGTTVLRKWFSKGTWGQDLRTALACFQYWPDHRVDSATYPVNLPDTVCFSPAPPEVTCDSIPSMEFDFGTVPAGRTDSLEFRRREFLSCTNATSVTLKLLSALVMSRSLTANIYVNGRRLGPNGVTLGVDGNIVELDFLVTTTGTEHAGGSYNASSVLLMEYN